MVGVALDPQGGADDAGEGDLVPDDTDVLDSLGGLVPGALAGSVGGKALVGRDGTDRQPEMFGVDGVPAQHGDQAVGQCLCQARRLLHYAIELFTAQHTRG